MLNNIFVVICCLAPCSGSFGKIESIMLQQHLPSVHRNCWLWTRKSIWLVKIPLSQKSQMFPQSTFGEQLLAYTGEQKTVVL